MTIKGNYKGKNNNNNNIETICAIIQRLFGQNKLITRFDGRIGA